MHHDIDGKVVRHTCDNPKCLNPEHLITGSPADNIKDMDKRGRRYRKYTKEICEKVRAQLTQGRSNKEISEDLNIDARRVSEIKTGHRTHSGKIAKP